MKTQRRFSSSKKIIARIVVYPVFVILLGLTIIYTAGFLMGPPDLSMNHQTTYYDQNGKKITSETKKEKRWVALKDMPPSIIDATIAIEDRRFFAHKGFDFKRIFGAIYKDIRTLSLKEGASTLTQQYSRSLYLSTEKTWKRKIKEAFYTVRLEMFYSKKDILEGYLNSVYYGYGAYGVEQASEVYFHKSVSDLSLAEAAMIAGIPKGPTYYSPFNDEERATKRQKLILREMLEANMIDHKAYAAAVDTTLKYAGKKQEKAAANVNYFTDTALREATNLLKLDRQAVQNGGFKIYTTLDKNAQKALDKTVKHTVPHNSEIELAVISMDPENGKIRALTGGKNHQKSQFNRAIDAKRMAGSSFKPFLYYAALNHGYNPTTMLNSKPTTFHLADGATYKPGNYNGYYADKPITLAQALALSDNMYAVKTDLYLGVEKLPEVARKFGITSKLPAVPSLALGSATVSLKEMVTGYGMLANGGDQVTAHTIEKIVDAHGKTVYEAEFKHGKNVLDPKKTFILTEMLTGIFDPSLNGYMSVTGSSIANKLSRPYAAKSGTTDSDSWMIGYSPDLVTGVWTGYDDNRNMDKVAEHAYAKDIWADFMEAAHQGKEVHDFPVPEGVIAVPIDPETGERATPLCSKSRVMYFEKGTEPTEYCNIHHGQQKKTDESEKGIFERWFDLLFG